MLPIFKYIKETSSGDINIKKNILVNDFLVLIERPKGTIIIHKILVQINMVEIVLSTGKHEVRISIDIEVSKMDVLCL